MTVIDTEDIALLGLVTVVAACRLSAHARQVGRCREKYSLRPPVLDGPEEFQRTFRAHQNFVEFFGPFLAVLWMAGIFLHQWPAAVVGAAYVYCREKYFWGYIESSEKRWIPFWRSIYCLMALISMAGVGSLGTLIGIL